MLSFDITGRLRKKLDKLAKRDRTLAEIFYKKVHEVVSRDDEGVQAYKNLRAPMNEFKRIHLTDNYILIFAVEKRAQGSHVVFVDIRHWDDVFG